MRMQGGEAAKRENEIREAEEVLKLELESHPNVYYVYTDELPVKEEEIAPKEQQPKRVKSSKKPGICINLNIRLSKKTLIKIRHKKS